MEDECTKEFIQVWEGLADQVAASEEWGVMTTILPERASSRELEVLRSKLRDLPMVKMSEEGAQADDIWLRDTLGQGGMGVVYLGRQRTLERDVAIKTLRRDRDEELAKREILREAWITGRLEHPNIIPIHSLGLDATGRPIIVMKRVEGRSWAEAISDPTRLPETYAGMDPIEAHLLILMQVCNAIHFAHTRKILHRDIKPENIMLGEFGEVYVLDWGIAVSTDEADLGKLPLARECVQLAGTPGYMAPEMVERKGRALSVRTDVYLLGAVLHEILTGKPRHMASSMRAAVLSSYVSAPFDYSGTQAPDELCELANHATHQSPDERPPSAEAFRQRIAEFLNHRESHQLREEADEHVETSYAMIEGGAPEDEETVRVLRQHVTKAMFGYQQAITLWPGNRRARASMRTFIEHVAAYEINRGDLTGAEGIASLLTRVPDELEAGLERLRAQRERDKQSVEDARQLERDGDLRISSRVRALAIVLILIVWLASSEIRGRVEASSLNDVALAWVTTAVVTAIIIGFRKLLLTTRLNRHVTSIFLISIFGIAIMRTIGIIAMDLSHAQCLAMERILAGAMLLHLGVSIDKRVLFIAPLMPLSGILIGFNLEHSALLSNVSNLLVFGGLAAMWSRGVPGRD